MPHRFASVVLTTVGLLAVAEPAAAVERFAKPGGTTAADCLTEATACALGKALEDTTAPTTYGGNIVTLLPGDYTTTDRITGALFADVRLTARAGVIVRGKPGAAAPTYTVSGGNALDEAARVAGNTFEHLVIRRTGAPQTLALELVGFAAGFGDPERPAILDRVVVEADVNSFGVRAEGPSRIVSSLIKQSGGVDGGAVDAATFPGQTPRIVNSTLISSGVGLFVGYGLPLATDTAKVELVNSVVRGAVKDVKFGTSAGTPLGSVTLATTTSAFRFSSTDLPIGQAVTGTGIAIDDTHLTASGEALAASPLIDAGTADAFAGSLDLAGNPRVSGPKIDIGAFELAAATPTPTATPGPTPTATPGPTPFVGLPNVPADTTKPSLSGLGSTKTLKRSKLSGRSGIDLTASIGEPGTVVAQLIVKTKKKGKTTEKILGSATAKTAAAGQVKLKLKIKGSKLGKGSLKATLRFTATDLFGNATVVESRTTVK